MTWNVIGVILVARSMGDYTPLLLFSVFASFLRRGFETLAPS